MSLSHCRCQKVRSGPVFKTFGENGSLGDLSMETGCSSPGRVGPRTIIQFPEKKKEGVGRGCLILASMLERDREEQQCA